MLSSSSLTLRALIQSAAARAGLAHDRGKITGLQGGARALYAAIRAHAAPNRLLIVVTPTDADLEAVVADARFFMGILEGLDDPSAAAAVLPLPSHEVDPYRG